MTVAAVSTDLFLSGVIGLIRLSDAARESYRVWRARKDVHVLPDSLEGMDEAFTERWALRHLRISPDPEISALRHNEYRDLFVNPDFENDLTVRADAVAKKIEAVARVREILLADETCIVNGERCALDDLIGVPCEDHGGRAVRMSRMLILQHELWEREPRSLWAPFARALVQTTMDVASMHPGVLGLSAKAEKILIGMGPTIDSILAMSWEDAGANSAAGVVDTFLAGALEVAANHPDLVTSERDLKPLVEGILTPLAEEAKREGGLRRLRAKRMREFFAGPLAHGVLKAVSDNADLYLKGEFASDELGGVIARATLADFVTSEPGAFNLRGVISEKSAVVLYNNLLATVAEQPGLVLADKGGVSDAVRDFLASAATRLQDAPRPYNWNSDLGADLLSSAFDAGGRVATVKLSRRIGKETAGSDWSKASQEIAASIVGGFVDGLKAEYGGADAGGTATRLPNVIESMFNRQQAIDLFRIVANTVAADPDIVLPADANRQTLALTRTIATAMSADTTGLLGSEDWRRVLSAGLEQAAKNPATLFSMDEDDPEQQILCVLLSSMMQTASANMAAAPSTPGRIMFGETLREAIIATLGAATTSVRGAVRGQDGSPSALEEFLTVLNGFLVDQAGSGAQAGAQVRMNADDWVRVFKHFIVEVLDTPPDAPASARVTRSDVVRLLRDIQPVVVSSAATQQIVSPPGTLPAHGIAVSSPPTQMEEVG